MGFKYQLVVCPRPEDIILITLNHLDTIKQFVSESERCCDMIQAACRRINEVCTIDLCIDDQKINLSMISHTQHYSPLSKAEFIVLRATMLSLLQDSHKRVRDAQFAQAFVLVTKATI